MKPFLTVVAETIEREASGLIGDKPLQPFTAQSAMGALLDLGGSLSKAKQREFFDHINEIGVVLESAERLARAVLAERGAALKDQS